MEYQVALSPELGLAPADLVSEWNATPASRRVADARLEHAGERRFDPTLAAGAMVVLGNVALSLASSALYDLIKAAVARRGVRRTTEVREVHRPDGTRLLVVTTTEE
jgi:hypothetical protein